jgi:hypothetical protein
MNKKTKQRNSGFTMALVLCVIVLLLLLGTSLLGLSENARIASTRRSQEIAAKCAADAGLTKILSDINYAYEQGTLELTNLPSEFVVDIENFDANFGYIVYLDATGDIIIDSTGTDGPCNRTVHCKVKVKSTRFEHALFADNFEIKNNAFIDGYNSDFGPYGGNNIITTSIGTNNTDSGAIDLDTIGYINGDISVGPGANPLTVIQKGTHFDVTGEMSAANEPKVVQIATPPSLLNMGLQPSGTITESGSYQEIKLGNNEIIEIDGDITLYITGDVELDNNAEIIITEGSSLTLYIGNSFTMSNGGKINNQTEKPPNCIVYSTATSEVDYLFDNTGTYHGAIYAPNANIEINNNAVFYGSILGKELKVDNSAEVYADHALLNGNYGDPETILTKGNWWE